MYVCTTFGLFVFVRGVFLHSRVTGAFPVTTDLIMQVDVRTTTTTKITTTTTNVQNNSIATRYLVGSNRRTSTYFYFSTDCSVVPVLLLDAAVVQPVLPSTTAGVNSIKIKIHFPL